MPEFEVLVLMGSEDNDAKMPAVGTEVTLKGKQYHILSELYDGPFSKVYAISKGCMQYAMKIERTAGSKRSFFFFATELFILFGISYNRIQ